MSVSNCKSYLGGPTSSKSYSTILYAEIITWGIRFLLHVKKYVSHHQTSAVERIRPSYPTMPSDHHTHTSLHHSQCTEMMLDGTPLACPQTLQPNGTYLLPPTCLLLDGTSSRLPPDFTSRWYLPSPTHTFTPRWYLCRQLTRNAIKLWKHCLP